MLAWIIMVFCLEAMSRVNSLQKGKRPLNTRYGLLGTTIRLRQRSAME